VVRRAVILVGNPARPYSRALRLGRTLVGMGFEVEIAATWLPDLPTEEADGAITIRRYPPVGRFASRAATGRAPVVREPASRFRARRVVRAVRSRLLEWILWPQTARGWWAALARDLAPADLYHACGVLALAPALDARRRDRRAGRRAAVIADVIDLSLESNNVLRFPAVVRRLLAIRDRRWGRAADARTAVNEPFGRWVTRRWRLSRPPVVVPNYPEPWTPPPVRPDRIREELGLPATTPICLFWGRLGPNMGLDEAAEAVLRVPGAVMVLLGFGRGWDASVARDADPRFAARHRTLPARHPDELLEWVASADVALVTLPPTSFNQRYTTPNKFLEAMAAGTPMVLGPDLPTMASILEREDLGTVAASMAPAALAAAIAAELRRSAQEGDAWRARIAEAARARYSWPIAAEAYRALVAGLVDPRS
jgi:glycosyltransferase involved in cell wall biosynthesis